MWARRRLPNSNPPVPKTSDSTEKIHESTTQGIEDRQKRLWVSLVSISIGTSSPSQSPSRLPTLHGAALGPSVGWSVGSTNRRTRPERTPFPSLPPESGTTIFGDRVECVSRMPCHTIRSSDRVRDLWFSPGLRTRSLILSSNHTGPTH